MFIRHHHSSIRNVRKDSKQRNWISCHSVPFHLFRILVSHFFPFRDARQARMLISLIFYPLSVSLLGLSSEPILCLPLSLVKSADRSCPQMLFLHNRDSTIQHAYQRSCPFRLCSERSSCIQHVCQPCKYLLSFISSGRMKILD